MPPPIFLLKTKSSPNDGYEDYFSNNNYTPTFVPVLEHRFQTSNLSDVREFFASGAFSTNTNTPIADSNEGSAQTGSGNSNGSGSSGSLVLSKRYGGMIFTSQRAVEGFANMIEEHGLPGSPPSIPLYTVGPATARTLTSLRDKYLPACTIHGAETGTGEKLAHLMLDHYNALQKSTVESFGDGVGAGGSDGSQKPGLLFLVGEQRRDIIPKTLMGPNLTETERINVDEIVVYETGEMDSFERDFAGHVQGSTSNKGADTDSNVWVVVFSPSGCEAILRVLKLGPFNAGGSEAGASGEKRKVFVATIGPTTRDYLRDRFGFEADVCAEKPSPEGVGEGIKKFMLGLGGSR